MINCWWLADPVPSCCPQVLFPPGGGSKLCGGSPMPSEHLCLGTWTPTVTESLAHCALPPASGGRSCGPDTLLGVSSDHGQAIWLPAGPNPAPLLHRPHWRGRALVRPPACLTVCALGSPTCRPQQVASLPHPPWVARASVG